MVDGRTNIDTAPFAHGIPSREDEPPYQFLDLSGEHLGVRVEVISPGGTTSHPHYHTAEEEHVILLAGEATLHLGDKTIALQTGDHVWFPAGEPVAHFIENASKADIKLLVLGERKKDDVVVYPKSKMMLMKSNGEPRIISYAEDETSS